VRRKGDGNVVEDLWTKLYSSNYYVRICIRWKKGITLQHNFHNTGNHKFNKSDGRPCTTVRSNWSNYVHHTVSNVTGNNISNSQVIGICYEAVVSCCILQVSGYITSIGNTATDVKAQSMSLVLHRNVLWNLHTCHISYHKSQFKSCTNLLEWLWVARRLAIQSHCPKTPYAINAVLQCSAQPLYWQQNVCKFM